MRNLETFNWIFEEFDKKLKLQTNFTDVYESSKFDRKVISLELFVWKKISDTQDKPVLKLKIFQQFYFTNRIRIYPYIKQG